MTITYYITSSKEYEEIKRKIKITKQLPRNTRIVFIKNKRKEKKTKKE